MKFAVSVFCVLFSVNVFATEAFVEVSEGTDLQKSVIQTLIAAINQVSDGDGEANISCFNSVADSFCTISNLQDTTRQTSLELNESSDEEKAVLLQLIQAINEVNSGSSVGGKGTDEAKISCFSSKPDTFCTVTSL